MYSQGLEEKHIIEFFGTTKGTVLDIGANDGKTFSNSLRLIELGWDAVLVEPSPACNKKIIELHGNNNVSKINLCKCAIGETTGKAVFHESGQLNDPSLHGAENISLVSTLIPEEKKRWDSLKMPWTEYNVKVYSWPDFLKYINHKEGDKFDFISLDAEGMDLAILKQIDLTDVKLLCIEFNSIESVKTEILEYTSKFGMNNIIYQSGENLLICR